MSSPVPSAQDSAPPRKGFTPITAVTFVIGGLALWVGIMFPEPMVGALFLLGVSTGIATRKRVLLGPAGLGFWAGYVLSVVASIAMPRTFSASHSLLPFEVALLGILSIPALWLGSAFGSALVGRLKDAAPGRQRNVSWAVLAVALVVLAWPSHYSQFRLKQGEENARRKIIALTLAQYAYRAAHPSAGFSCSLGDLGVSGMNPPSAETVVEGNYSFNLSCVPRSVPQERFTIAAGSLTKGAGLLNFCSDETGYVSVIPAIDEGSLKLCRQKGAVIATVEFLLKEGETDARKKAIALTRAQFAYRAAHPSAGFSCSLGDLGMSGLNPPSGDTGVEGDYTFSVSCEPRSVPQDRFTIVAGAHIKEAGMLNFCSDQTGEVRALPAAAEDSLKRCWQMGAVIATVPAK